MRRKKIAQLLCVLVVGVMAPCASRQAWAQDGKYSLRETAGLGIVTSNDQIKFLKYDKTALLGSVQLARRVLPWLELHVSTQASAFFSQKRTGGLLDVTIGPLFRVERRGLSPWVAADVGPGLTGKLVRPYFAITAGLDTPLKGRNRIGPVIGYGQLVQWNGLNYLTDARFMWFGISLRQDLGWTPTPAKKPAQLPPRLRPVEVATPEPSEPPPSSGDVLELIERALPTSTQRVELLAPVLFGFDSDKLQPTGIAMLHEVKRTLETRPEIKLVQIEGYADQRGNAEHNRALSQRRAERVRAWLVEHGISPDRLSVAARGADELVETGESEASHEQNRRVIFRVVEQGAGP